MSREFDRAYWEEQHSGHTAARTDDPNPHLVGELDRLAPGTALDAGCGHGAEARWLAARGWRVTAVDIATAALRRARDRAEPLGAEITDRITWLQADLTDWIPTERGYDLVISHYVHPAGSREVLFRRLAAAVAPGGTLLVVGHHPSDSHSAARASGPQVHFTAEEIAADLDPQRWEIVVAETRTRSVAEHADHAEHAGNHGHDAHADHEGRGAVLRDTVLRARKRA
ncbi:class I SAM-dependent methyltransferase [Actinopolyspora halophila]|uniref:class I SAM-dependent methyltransferase n=1 Tax=Actinopolyspora halophila TaxID=1850 RepID=UPI000376FF98|nr:class I SAM-dependent methyltransferase [Actinopolyspora halophila]